MLEDKRPFRTNIYTTDAGGMGVLAFLGAGITAIGLISSLAHEVTWFGFACRVLGSAVLVVTWGQWRNARVEIDGEGVRIFNRFGRRTYAIPWSRVKSLTLVSNGTGPAGIFLFDEARTMRLSTIYVRRGELALELESRLTALGAVEQEKRTPYAKTLVFVRDVGPSVVN